VGWLVSEGPGLKPDFRKRFVVGLKPHAHPGEVEGKAQALPPQSSADDEAMEGLRGITEARLSLGLGAGAVSTREQLRFQMDHALARDAVHAELDVAMLVRGLGERGLETLALRSAVTGGRKEYLRRPDLGRRLDPGSAETLDPWKFAVASSQVRESGHGAPGFATAEVVFVIADGLSALAVERHVLPLMDAVMAGMDREQWKMGPVCVVTQGRVAVGDEIGVLLGAKVVVVLIGERPGLSAADSLGVYLTWEPRIGRTDAERNCISNVRLEGLGYVEAARRILFYMEGARRSGASGVVLKEAAGSERALEGGDEGFVGQA